MYPKQIFVVLGAIAIAGVLLWTVYKRIYNPIKVFPEIQAGVLDLRTWNFERDGPVSLSGEVEFYWEKLLTPKDFAFPKTVPQPSFVEIPAPWNSYQIKGQSLTGDGYATYRLIILLPDVETSLAFDVPEFETAYRFYLNGKIVSTNGRVGKTPQTMRPQWLPKIVISKSQKQLELILQVSNFYHRKGGAGQTILLGTEEDIRWLREKNLDLEQFLLGSILIVGLYHLGLFSFRKTDKSSLYFGICCLLVSIRILASGEYYLAYLVPGINWELLIKLNYLSLFLVIPFFATFIYTLFPQESPEWFLRLVQAVGFLFSSITLFTAARFFTYTLQTYQFFILVGCAYFVYILFQAITHQRDDALVFLTGFLILLFTVVNDILHNNFIILTTFMAPFGIFLFIFFQAFLLSRRFSRAFFKVEALSAELEQRVTERTRQLSLSNQQLLQTNQELSQEITERLQIENALMKAKEAAETANRTKSAFLASMSHELRTPLNIILGFAQLLSHNPKIDSDQQKTVKVILHSGEHLLNLINDVLDMSKIEAGRMTLTKKEFDLYRLLEDLENMFRLRAEDKGLSLIFDRWPSVPRYVRTDEGKLRQVLINLLNNALKFTSTGTVWLRIRCEEVEDSSQQNSDLDSSASALLHFEIEDTGPGIDPKEWDDLFKPFVQTESGRKVQEGTGLGLPISQKFVQLMGGEIKVESQLEQGTIFYFNICIEQVENYQAAKLLHQPTRQGVALAPDQPLYRILIVDDRWENRQLLVQMLEPLGFVLAEAKDGQEALEQWQTFDPHLIWLDMRIPIMDGYQVTQRIKAEETETVIIALITNEDERIATVNAGCDDFLLKPFHEADIFMMISEYIGVRYRYEEDSTLSKDADVETDKDWVASLALLPPDLLEEFAQATLRLDTGEVKKLIDQIHHYDSALADKLALLADKFEYDKILVAIQDAKGKD